ncbi:MAG: TIGR04552 family protein [Oligoflexia bacterium]|nr:TIGR04552 family protein [Oligoflexia bacterium]MBF0367320.1 TIGR04552 family protein [Oligoflexia bacterium]
MNRPDYLEKYRIDWELINVVAEGQSALDTRSFLIDYNNKTDVLNFLKGYGLDQNNPVLKAELFGNFQEAMQFIRKYFLKENNPEGLDLHIPPCFFNMTEASELFIMINNHKRAYEERLWAMAILKVMHTIIHLDKDLRHNYFSVIQQQIFDRFYKYLSRDERGLLYLGPTPDKRIPLHSFTTKAKKTRDSIIIKLLHKPENVAEELFDRVGLRIVTNNKYDAVRVIKFLQQMNIITPHNTKPSRSFNSLIDIKLFRSKFHLLIRESIRENLSEQLFLEKFHHALENSEPDEKKSDRNEFTSRKYRAIQFTCRQLIKYKNPFLLEFSSLRTLAKKTLENDHDNLLAKKILDIDIMSTTKDISFFYPFEIQITDSKNHEINTRGEASHQEYKNQQLKNALVRIFHPLITFKNIKF